MYLGEAIVAGIVLAICTVMLLRLALGEQRRHRFDRAIQLTWARGPQTWWLRWQRRQTERRTRRETARRQAASVRMEANAEQEAKDIIARARQSAQGRGTAPGAAVPRHDADVDGNVIRPKAFRSSGKSEPGAAHPGKDTLH